MLKILGSIRDKLNLILRKVFFNSSHQGRSSGYWKRQAQLAGGLSGVNRAKYNNYGTEAGRSVHSKKYSPAEVKRCLRGLEQHERSVPVLVEAAQFSALLRAGMRRQFRGRERIFDRLPYVLFQYTQGKPSQEIARSVSYFADAQDVEDAMDFAARLITVRLNRAQ